VVEGEDLLFGLGKGSPRRGGERVVFVVEGRKAHSDGVATLGGRFSFLNEGKKGEKEGGFFCQHSEGRCPKEKIWEKRGRYLALRRERRWEGIVTFH